MTAPFPTQCPKCGALGRYDYHKSYENKEHRYGKTAWECGYTLERLPSVNDEPPTEIVSGKCRRVACT